MARIDLSMSHDEFMELTPHLFNRLMARHDAVKNREVSHFEFMLAQLTSWVANTGFRSVDKQVKPQDFMPSHWAKTRTTTVKRKRLTKKRQKEIAQGIRAMFPDLSKANAR